MLQVIELKVMRLPVMLNGERRERLGGRAQSRGGGE